MNVDQDTSILIAAELGTQIHSFPQTYLGLPLPPYKLPHFTLLTE
jgi:hypothetical protein